MELNLTTIVAAAGGLANLVWMLTTLRIENRIGSKIEELKGWMEDRYVSVPEFEGRHATVAVRLGEIERRLVQLEAVRP